MRIYVKNQLTFRDTYKQITDPTANDEILRHYMIIDVKNQLPFKEF